MNCPHCNIPLMISDRKGIEIDFCTQCRGVWLDKGELDKLIELSVSERMHTQPAGGYGSPRYTEREQYDSYGGRQNYTRHDYKHGHPRYKSKRKKSMLGEIFDIFD